MNRLFSATFCPEKPRKKVKRYQRILLLTAISVCINLLVLGLFMFPGAMKQLASLRALYNSEQKPIPPVEPVLPGLDHSPVLYMGQSFSADPLNNRVTHSARLLKLLDDPMNGSSFQVNTRMHQVQKGETLDSIARLYQVSVPALRIFNGMSTGEPRTGKILKILSVDEPLGYYGIDLSARQSGISWEVRKSDTIPPGLDFYMLRATQGISDTDQYFTHYWEQVRKQGRMAGGYHVYVPGEDPVKQADHYARYVKLAEGNLRPVVDVEHMPDSQELPVSEARFIADLEVFLGQLERAYGVKPVIYTNMAFYERYLSGNFSRYPYWMASYTQEAPGMMSLLSEPDPEILPAIYIWQFSASENVPGVAGPVSISFLPMVNVHSMLY